ncbi:MAG: serine/threonine-protein phosphatase [Leptospira sp.]|nr:serine/threonine-protein phosphatase [Leptospira sp.]NCS94225.1 serine/threonine-protein phosphatase [Leptospira sp.]
MSKTEAEHIKDSRGANLARLIFGIIFLISFIVNGFYLMVVLSFFHLITAIIWFWLIERRYSIYDRNPILWYLPASLDLMTISASVFTTGISYSPAILGYVVVTTLSSTDMILNRGKFVAYASSLIFLLMNSFAYLDIYPIVNIVTDTQLEMTTFSFVLSNLLLILVCLLTNKVISSIYLLLNEKNLKLSESLEKINELKLQQDGDYYLTSLLLEPLASNQTHSQHIKIEFSIRQYKRFIFRDFMNELGGDICLADTLSLGSKKYTIIVNGDAMGKSMQGAGGALVIGVVLKSIITRTQLIAEADDVTPAIWLERSLRELNEVFYSFDGYMLVSVFIGLLEEESAMLYFVNAEHPSAVLFRDSKASYIPNDTQTRKIGTLGESKSTKVESFQLELGDTIFIGSDGKDDLVVEVNELGERKIASDEEIFLNLIEKYEGNLEKVVAEIENQFELTDDFSVIKISYN